MSHDLRLNESYHSSPTKITLDIYIIWEAGSLYRDKGTTQLVAMGGEYNHGDSWVTYYNNNY